MANEMDSLKGLLSDDPFLNFESIQEKVVNTAEIKAASKSIPGLVEYSDDSVIPHEQNDFSEGVADQWNGLDVLLDEIGSDGGDELI